MNITQLLVLGQEWNSAILTNVSQSLSTDSSNANVGSLNGMRVFYNNDYLVRFLCSTTFSRKLLTFSLGAARKWLRLDIADVLKPDQELGMYKLAKSLWVSPL